MSAELLRRAAQHLRLIAERLPEGHWTYQESETEQGEPMFDLLLDGAVVAGVSDGSDEPSLAATVATLLDASGALAEWLDANAEWMREAYTLTKGDDTNPIDACDQAAVAVARAILREDS